MVSYVIYPTINSEMLSVSIGHIYDLVPQKLPRAAAVGFVHEEGFAIAEKLHLIALNIDAHGLVSLS
jgi:hypothetical protein